MLLLIISNGNLSNSGTYTIINCVGTKGGYCMSVVSMEKSSYFDVTLIGNLICKKGLLLN